MIAILKRFSVTTAVSALFFVLLGTGAFANTAVNDGFTVTGDTANYTYVGDILTIIGNGDFIIANTDPTTPTTDTIIVNSGVTANITLKDVNIDVSGTDNACAFQIQNTATANITLLGTNTLHSGKYKAGLQVELHYITNKNITYGTLIITAASTGSLTATGGYNGAGIGDDFYSGNKAHDGSGHIFIHGGTVTATGTGGGAGIGGGGGITSTNATLKDGSGSGTNASVISITGGTLVATGGIRAAGIGAGAGDGINIFGVSNRITISGGDVTANGGADAANNGGAGIGDSYGNTIDTYSNFDTTTTGTALIRATAGDNFGAHINGLTFFDQLSGIIFRAKDGTVHGTQTLLSDITNPSDSTFVIENNSSLTLAEGVTFTNYLSFVMSDNSKLIINNGATFINREDPDPHNNQTAQLLQPNEGSIIEVHGMLDIRDAVFTIDLSNTLNVHSGGSVILGSATKLHNSGAIKVFSGGMLRVDYNFSSYGNIYGTGTIDYADPVLYISDTVLRFHEVAGKKQFDFLSNGATIPINYTGDVTLRSETEAEYNVLISSGVHNITLDGVKINSTRSNGIQIGDSSLSPVTANITLKGDNTLQSVSDAMLVFPGSTLNITAASTGTLTATGAINSTGIGAGGTVNIAGGTVNALGGENAAGIGSGYEPDVGAWPIGNINILGGTIFAEGGYGAAGIGGANGGDGGNITISGGNVTARGTAGGVGIGAGNGGNAGTLIISGGVTTAIGGEPLSGTTMLSAFSAKPTLSPLPNFLTIVSAGGDNNHLSVVDAGTNYHTNNTVRIAFEFVPPPVVESAAIAPLTGVYLKK